MLYGNQTSCITMTYLDSAGGERLHTSSIVKTLKSRTDLVEFVLVSKLATYITSLQSNFCCLFVSSLLLLLTTI